MINKSVEITALDGHRVKGTFKSVENPKATIVMVHGITADRHEWGYYDLLSDALLHEGVSSLAIDLRGHGLSEMDPRSLSLSGVMLDIQAASTLLMSLCPDAIHKFIIGNSFGGGVSYLYAQETCEFTSIILTAPVLGYVKDIGKAADSWQSDDSLNSFTYVTFDLSKLLIPEMYWFDHRINHSTDKVPFTILHGAIDSDVPLKRSKQFLEGRRNGDLLVLPDMDHCWAEPGDLPPFTAEKSVANRCESVAVTVEKISQLLNLPLSR